MSHAPGANKRRRSTNGAETGRSSKRAKADPTPLPLDRFADGLDDYTRARVLTLTRAIDSTAAAAVGAETRVDDPATGGRVFMAEGAQVPVSALHFAIDGQTLFSTEMAAMARAPPLLDQQVICVPPPWHDAFLQSMRSVPYLVPCVAGDRCEGMFINKFNEVLPAYWEPTLDELAAFMASEDRNATLQKIAEARCGMPSTPCLLCTRCAWFGYICMQRSLVPDFKFGDAPNMSTPRERPINSHSVALGATGYYSGDWAVMNPDGADTLPGIVGAVLRYSRTHYTGVRVQAGGAASVSQAPLFFQ